MLPQPTLPNPHQRAPGGVPVWLAILEGVSICSGLLLWAYACLNLS